MYYEPNYLKKFTDASTVPLGNRSNRISTYFIKCLGIVNVSVWSDVNISNY